jgi:hypothetical protein
MINIFSLFDGRHPLPNNTGAIFSGFDFDRFAPIRSSHYDTVVSLLTSGDSVSLYITGLTPALTDFLSTVAEIDGRGVLTLLHFNSGTSSYIARVF